MAQQPPRKDPTDIRGWPLGVNNVAPDYSLPDGSLRNGVNVDILDSGKVRRRKGFTEALAGTDVHSLWATGQGDGLFVEGDSLMRLSYANGAWTSTALLTGFQGRRVWYLNLNGETYYSNGVQSGVYNNQTVRSWGVEDPSSAPNLTGVTGSMLAGRYQVAITFLRNDGEESGASVSAAYTLSSDGGIFLNAIPQPTESDVDTTRVYATMPNGEVFYQVADLPVGYTSFLLSSVYPGMTLKTQFSRRFPACTHLSYANGRIYGASGNVALYTDALRYGQYTPDRNYLPYAAPVSMIQGMPDGVFIAADRTYFVRFEPDGETPVQRDVLPYGAISGLAGEIADSTDRYWFSTEGIVIGKAGGAVENVMNKAVAVDEYAEGASLYREQDGVAQIVCSLNGKGETSAFSCSDYAEAEVIRRSRT